MTEKPASRPIRLLLVDDQPLVRESMHALLEARPAFAVVGEAGTVGQGLGLVPQAAPHLVLVDMELKGGETGLGLIRSLREQHPDVRILVVSMHNKPNYVRKANEAGAHGYVLKDDPSSFLFPAIEKVADGGRIYSPNLDWSELLWGKLTPMERKVAFLIAKGFGNAQIAALLTVHESTTKSHRAHIREKLCLSSAVEIADYIRNNGIIAGDDVE